MLHHGRRAAPEHEGLQAYASKCCARCLRQRPLEICKGCGLFGFCSPECRQAGAEDHAAECGALPKLASLLRAAGGEVWHDGDALHNALLLARVLRAKPRPDDPIAKLASPLAGRPLVLRTFLVQPRLAIPVAIARAVLAAAEHWPALLATPARARPPRDRQEWPPEPPPGSREPQVEVLVGVLLQQQVNACCIFDPEVRETMGAPPGEGVFPEGALTNHSCSPNCQFMYRLGATPLQYVLCVAEVATGEELTVSYGDVTRPVWERRPRIESSHWFRCSCARCEREVKRQGLLDPSSLSRVADVRGRVLRSALSAAASHGGDPCTALEVAGAAFAPAADDRRVAAAFREFQEAKAAASKAGEVGVQSDYLRAACRTLRSLESVMHPDDSALLAELRSRANLLKAEEEEQAEEVAFNWQEGRAMVASLAVDDWVRRVTILGDDLFVGTASSGVRRYRVGEQSARQRYEVGGDPMQAVVADHPAGSDPETSVTSLSFDGRWLAAGLAGGRLHIWAAEGGEPVLEDALLLFDLRQSLLAWAEAARSWSLASDVATALCVSTRRLLYDLHPHRCALFEARWRLCEAAGKAEEAAEAWKETAELRQLMRLPPLKGTGLTAAAAATVTAATMDGVVPPKEAAAGVGAAVLRPAAAAQAVEPLVVEVVIEPPPSMGQATENVRLQGTSAPGVTGNALEVLLPLGATLAQVVLDVSRDGIRVTFAGLEVSAPTPFEVDESRCQASFSKPRRTGGGSVGEQRPALKVTAWPASAATDQQPT
mmetsp:Transcript_155250/g.498077  ORF Transcript_155250/g.498077 Transcript_155250/m.498077 type:complete len:772 (+) Transcript_155250:336-2651(+)